MSTSQKLKGLRSGQEEEEVEGPEKSTRGEEVDNCREVDKAEGFDLMIEKSTSGEVKTSSVVAKMFEKLTSGEVETSSVAAKMSQNPPPSAPWASLFKENRKLENGLKLREWNKEEWELKEEDFNKIEDSWGICIVGFILGRFSGRKAIDDVRNKWDKAHKFYMHNSGWMVFKFDCEEDREFVLSNEPYNTFGTPWILKIMPPFFKFGDECFNNMQEFLSKLMSTRSW